MQITAMPDYFSLRQVDRRKMRRRTAGIWTDDPAHSADLADLEAFAHLEAFADLADLADLADSKSRLSHGLKQLDHTQVYVAFRGSLPASLRLPFAQPLVDTYVQQVLTGKLLYCDVSFHRPRRPRSSRIFRLNRLVSMSGSLCFALGLSETVASIS